jgi:hypothetical protein
VCGLVSRRARRQRERRIGDAGEHIEGIRLNGWDQGLEERLSGCRAAVVAGGGESGERVLILRGGSAQRPLSKTKNTLIRGWQVQTRYSHEFWQT